MDEYNVPAAVDEERKQKSGGGGGPRSLKQQRLRPYKEGAIEDNHLQFLLYNPSVWDMYRGVIAPSVRSYWMALFYHYMGSGKDRVSALCKKEMNAYYAEKYGSPIIFAQVICPSCGLPGVFANCVGCHTSLGVRVRDDICPSCDEATRKWNDYDEECIRVFKERNLPIGDSIKSARYKLKKEQNALYKDLTKAGTRLKELQEIASAWTARDRFMYIVFDIDKMKGRRQLQEGEPAETSMTILFAGKTIQEALEQKHNNRKRFWDPTAAMEIVITRNTENGLERSDYKIDDAAGPTFAPDWVAYLTNYEAMPDPSTEVTVLSYDDHVNKAGLALTREEVVAQPSGPPAGGPPAGPPASGSTSGPPTSPPASGLGRPAPTPGAPPATPPTSGLPRSGPPVLGAPPTTPPPPAGAPTAPPTAPPAGPPGSPPVPNDPGGRRQTW